MSLVVFFQSIRNPIFTFIAGLLSLAGNEIVFLCILGVIFWCLNKNVAYRIALAYVLAGPVFFIVRGFARVPRPWLRNSSLKPIPLASQGAFGYSMPSAHTLNAAAVGARFVTNTRMILVKIAAVAAVILVAFSRIYMGLNIWLEVLISVIIVVAATIISDYLLDNIRFDPSRNHIYAFLAVIPTLIMLGITLSLYGYGTIDLENLVVAVNNSGIIIGLIASAYLDQTFTEYSVRCDYAWQQLVKGTIGILIILIVRGSFSFLLKAIFPQFLFGDFFCNLLGVLIAFGFYPMVIRRVLTGRDRD